jgi:hypothetical protein
MPSTRKKTMRGALEPRPPSKAIQAPAGHSYEVPPRPRLPRAGFSIASEVDGERSWWARRDLNPQPTDYESAALTIELQARARKASSNCLIRRGANSLYLLFVSPRRGFGELFVRRSPRCGHFPRYPLSSGSSLPSSMGPRGVILTGWGANADGAATNPMLLPATLINRPSS